MPRKWAFFGLLALIFGFNAGFLLPASAEFFGCNDQHPARASYARAPSHSRASPVTHEFAAQSRPRITIHPRRHSLSQSAKRHCESWLAKEYRISGPVIVPRMRCRWE
jgi:hypothetical protein